MKYDIKNIKLAEEGRRKINWAAREMGVLATLETRFKKQKPFLGVRISACLHVSTETGRLMQVLKAGGAQVVLCASNPLSTKDDVAASLVAHDKISVFARHGASRSQFYRHLTAALDSKPHITMDDGADLLALAHTKYRERIPAMYGSTEETTTGIIRLRAMEADGALKLPVIAVNDAQTKHLFDNRYGTGQSTLDGIIRATNVLLAGKTVVVAGYGWCGKGVAMRARGMGSHVAVTEIDPVRALEAVMDGFTVVPMKTVAPRADIIITVTGNCEVISAAIIKRLKDGCIIANSGHFDVEIDVASLKKMAKKSFAGREHVESYVLPGARTINLLTEGRLVNLAAAEGHPSSVMDTSFAGQALAAEYLVKNYKTLAQGVHGLPDVLDQTIASLKLSSLRVKHDILTGRQKNYLNSWGEGT
ncbi:adenosylhomocysteinase [bacterium CG10_46_32]|nr:MAG: adenosylhomocysteinase [bacterium CG10_46_32]PIR55857.1 MAG: adenosylhomocysteinase [Parcubacteria group bacterium CG10_big_fil_rev_8_21_14_0_10_46_32]